MKLNLRICLAILVCALVAVGVWKGPSLWNSASINQSSIAPNLEAIRLFTPARDIPPFSLAQSDDTRLVPGELRGHWTLVFIGFTHCPDVCPTTLAQLSKAQNNWMNIPEAERPRVLFVSVDPDRDTPDQVGQYAHGFHKDTLAATADIPSLEKFTNSLSMIFKKMPPEPGQPADQYSVDHSASLAILNPRGQLTGFAMPPLNFDAIGRDMLTLSAQK